MTRRKSKPVGPLTEAEEAEFKRILHSYRDQDTKIEPIAYFDLDELEKRHRERQQQIPVYECRPVPLSELDEETKRKYGLE